MQIQPGWLGSLPIPISVTLTTKRLNGCIARVARNEGVDDDALSLSGRRQRKRSRTTARAACCSAWFDLGALLGSFGVVAVPLWLVLNLCRSVRAVLSSPHGVDATIVDATIVAAAAQGMTPMVPGLNLPLADLPFLAVALVMSLAVHEFGHAVAAISQGLRVLHVGAHFSIFTPIFPGFFVSIDSALEALPPRKQLRIFCAGCLHNAALTAACVLALRSPTLLTCCTVITHGTAPPLGDAPLLRGAFVEHIPSESPLRGALHRGDRITALNGDAVASSGEWIASLKRWHAELRAETGRGLQQQQQHQQHEGRALRRGFCSASATALDEPLRPLLPPCCTDPLHAALLCVSWHERNLSSAPGPVHFAPPLPHHACVSAAAITTPGSRTCSSSAECSDAGVESENEEEEEEEERCLLPVLRAGGAARGRGGGGSEPASAVFRLRLERSRSTSNSTGTAQQYEYAVFIGSPAELHDAVAVTRSSGSGRPTYRPRAYLSSLPFNLGDGLFDATESLARVLIKVLQYTAAVSLSIGVLNAAPVFRLDGAYCWSAILRMGCSRLYRAERLASVTHSVARTLMCNSKAGVHTVRKAVERLVLAVGSLLLVANIALAMGSLLLAQ